MTTRRRKLDSRSRRSSEGREDNLYASFFAPVTCFRSCAGARRELVPHFLVATSIASDFRFPELLARSWPAKEMAVMPVPETAVDEYYRAMPREHDVGLAVNIGPLDVRYVRLHRCGLNTKRCCSRLCVWIDTSWEELTDSSSQLDTFAGIPEPAGAHDRRRLLYF